MLVYQKKDNLVGVMNKYDYQRYIELVQDALIIQPVLVTHNIPVLTFYTHCDTHNLPYYAGSWYTLVEYCLDNNIAMERTLDKGFGIYIPFSCDYEKGRYGAVLQTYELSLLPNKEKFRKLNIESLFEPYHNLISHQVGSS